MRWCGLRGYRIQACSVLRLTMPNKLTPRPLSQRNHCEPPPHGILLSLHELEGDTGAELMPIRTSEAPNIGKSQIATRNNHLRTVVSLLANSFHVTSALPTNTVIRNAICQLLIDVSVQSPGSRYWNSRTNLVATILKRSSVFGSRSALPSIVWTKLDEVRFYGFQPLLAWNEENSTTASQPNDGVRTRRQCLACSISRLVSSMKFLTDVGMESEALSPRTSISTHLPGSTVASWLPSGMDEITIDSSTMFPSIMFVTLRRVTPARRTSTRSCSLRNDIASTRASASHPRDTNW